VGHHGVQRTLDKLRQQGVGFEGMRALYRILPMLSKDEQN
jgi:hypothetical protein